jgi:hypothetical protein
MSTDDEFHFQIDSRSGAKPQRSAVTAKAKQQAVALIWKWKKTAVS